MLTTARCSSQVAVESRLHGLTSGRVFDTKSVKTEAWAIAETQYGEGIAAARALVAANLSLPTAWASGAQVQRVGEGGQGGHIRRRPPVLSLMSRRSFLRCSQNACARLGLRESWCHRWPALCFIGSVGWRVFGMDGAFKLTASARRGPRTRFCGMRR